MILVPADHEAVAAEALAAIDGARQIAPFSARYPGLTLEDAYRISARLCALRTARGERLVGRKIGFTNRNIWAEYGVCAPMWGFVFDTTVRDLPSPRQAAQRPPTRSSSITSSMGAKTKAQRCRTGLPPSCGGLWGGQEFAAPANRILAPMGQARPQQVAGSYAPPRRESQNTGSTPSGSNRPTRLPPIA